MNTIDAIKQAREFIDTVTRCSNDPALVAIAGKKLVIMDAAIKRKEAQTVESMKATPKDMAIYRSIAAQVVKQPLSAEREALIADLRRLEAEQMHSIHAAWICAAADMLAADAETTQNLERSFQTLDRNRVTIDWLFAEVQRLKKSAQQVAVPQEPAYWRHVVQLLAAAGHVEQCTVDKAFEIAALHAPQLAADLTDSEMVSIAYDCNALPEVITDATLIQFARAVLAEQKARMK